jgi:hypothetical protein
MKRRTEAQWRALFSEFEASGMTALAFCQERGLSPKYFGRKRKQLREKGEAESGLSFVRVAVSARSEGEMIELCLGDGLRLRMPTTVCAHWLAGLVRQLRG